MPDARTELVARVRRALSHARAAARDQLDLVEADLAAAEHQLKRAQRAAEQVPARAGAHRDQRLAELTDRYHDRITAAARVAVAAANRAAPGAASSDWTSWTPAPAPRTEPPGMLRIGLTGLTGGPPVPALVPLLDHGHVLVDGDDLAGRDAVISTLLLRALGRAAPGGVRLTGYDPEHLGGGLAGFAPLAGPGLLSFVGPGGLGRHLDELVDHVRRINETVLAGEFGSLRELAAATGRRPEPWRIGVLLGSAGEELSRHERAQLDRIARAGAACGVHLVVRDVPLGDTPALTTVSVSGGTARISGYAQLPVRLDAPPPPELVTRTCREVASAIMAGPEPAAFADLLPEQEWTGDATSGITAPVGESTHGRPVEVTLSDYPPHALIGGPSGTGKTNLIYAWIGALAARYSPTELEFYLLDFKEGVSFARFAPGRRDPSFLPHVRLVGVNVNTDREFGLAMLHFLGAQLRRRADAAKRHEVTKLAELRAEDPQGRWPRIVAVIDEFQVLLAGNDALATEAATLLEDLARRGRSQGIHLILASQDVSGIQALWGRTALIAQFALRIALPKARRILPETNTAAEALPRHHAVVNAESGALEANQVVRVPAASDRDTWQELQHRLWRRRPDGLAPPRLFDGDAVPRLAQAPDYLALSGDGSGPHEPVALLGETIDVLARSARLGLPRAPGRNLAVLGTRVDEACALLDAAARSLARQYPPGAARFDLACLDPDAVAAARQLHAALPAGTGLYDLDTVGGLLADTADRLAVDAVDAPVRPHFLVLYAVDAAAGRLAAKFAGRSGLDRLRRVLHLGPERHTHVLGWWRGVARMRDDLGGIGSRTDQIGAWVALDVHGAELAPPLYPKAGGPTWYPRPWRALFFDRTVHRTAEVIIPYGLS
ncbi:MULTISPECIES: FtsK/SpoIIIE domain-containing protein [unclassified Solwaraspora]|uniref:FtsK/SpoIIIE domain-containing protein n=1 Tax=unclassified Solwaraspora TaxID=2627926 RepID=UPI00259B2D51|nr:FtsK/SpoIIIE domain-containing protein [Solwaraspora sp. WMMA2056]WJK39034.1 FtsK/SpoIIIE domain-containing protein [Solwaraspora sp. WMMA2056]